MEYSLQTPIQVENWHLELCQDVDVVTDGQAHQSHGGQDLVLIIQILKHHHEVKLYHVKRVNPCYFDLVFEHKADQVLEEEHEPEELRDKRQVLVEDAEVSKVKLLVVRLPPQVSDALQSVKRASLVKTIVEIFRIKELPRLNYQKEEGLRNARPEC